MTKHPLTPEDMLDFKNVRDARISPDGALVAFSVVDIFKTDTKKPRSAIWMVRSDGSNARPFTAGPRSDDAPRWSPDSRTLAFLSDRIEDGCPQIYLILREGGEAQAYTKVAGKILEIEWARDGRQILFLMEDAEPEEQKKRKQDKFDEIAFEQHPRFGRIWTLDLETRATRQVTEGNVHVWEWDEAPGGRGLVLLVSDTPSEQEWYRPRLARVPAEGGVPQTIFTPGGNKQIAMPRWSPDGRRIAFISCLWSDRGLIAGDLWVIAADGSDPRNLTDGALRDVSSFEWAQNGSSLIVMGFENGQSSIGRVDVSTGNSTLIWSGDAAFADRFWQHFTLSRDDSLLATVREDASNPPDVWVAHLRDDSAEWHQLTRINPQSAGIESGALEQIAWKSRDGLEIQGYLLKPVGYEPGRRYPMVVWVHGGPASNYGPRYYALGTSRFAVLAAKGIMVLLPNPRGSVGRGVQFTESNVGDMGGMDWQDILAGIEYCIDQGWADEERLGLGGWSYGGFMTAWGIVSEGRTKLSS